jgi:glycosyltransferase involved in cell wall biosynthesis
VFASVALYEPFGLAVLEAAQAGCPLVLSDIPTFRELWDGAAVFVGSDDDAAIAAALEGLLRDPEERARAGAAARERAGRYTVGAMTAGVLGVYRDLLAARTARVLAEAAA